MHPKDVELFSALQTVEISRYMTRRETRVIDSSHESKWITQKMKSLRDKGSLSKCGFRYYQKTLKPSESGFYRRWRQYLGRYTEVFITTKLLADKTDKQRLDLLLSHLTDHFKLVTKTGISDNQTFEGDEQNSVARYGFVGLTKTQESMIGEDGNFTDLVTLSCFCKSEAMLMNIGRTIQTYGFLIYEPETHFNVGKVGFVALLGNNFKQKELAA